MLLQLTLSLPIETECRYVVLMVSEAFGERSNAIAITLVAIYRNFYGIWTSQAEKKGNSSGETIQSSPAESTHHTDDCETRVQHNTSPTVAIRIEGQSMVLQDYNSRQRTPTARRAKRTGKAVWALVNTTSIITTSISVGLFRTTLNKKFIR